MCILSSMFIISDTLLSPKHQALQRSNFTGPLHLYAKIAYREAIN